jgi:hypothetical protein
VILVFGDACRELLWPPQKARAPILAKAIGLDVSQDMLSIADQVIE